jgi:Domain of unknown function (DUF4249)
MRINTSICILCLLLLLQTRCRKPYEPAVLVKGDNYLVVDGYINTSANAITTIILSRTKNLTDTVLTIPERNASVAIQSSAGTIYPLQENGDGVYNSGPLNLAPNGQYKVVVTTSANKRYASDLVSAKQTPAIDSVAWRQDDKGVNLFVNCHDPSGNTRFYRWQYIQTWEYHSQLETPWGITSSGVVYVRNLSQQVHVCYNTTRSTNVLIATTAALSADVISDIPIGIIPANDSTLQYRASFLLQQYALTAPAYFYWQIIEKNSQQLGTLFDLQPSQLEGNIHCISNPNEPVVGFMSAGTVTEKRIFVNNSDLQNWQVGLGSYECVQTAVPQNPVDFLLVNNLPDDSFAPYYYVSFGPLIVAKKVCLDCTLSGGTNVKPSFW